MQIDVDYYTCNSNNDLPSKCTINKIDHIFLEYLIEMGVNGNHTPVVRMYGITEGGHSVMVHIHNFLPYLYVECLPNFQSKFDNNFLEKVKDKLNKLTAIDGAKDYHHSQQAVVHIES